MRGVQRLFVTLILQIMQSYHRLVMSDGVGDRWRTCSLKLFFEHFTHTSFIAEKNGELIGFLIGFLSQPHTDEAYIHFVGIHL